MLRKWSVIPGTFMLCGHETRVVPGEHRACSWYSPPYTPVMLCGHETRVVPGEHRACSWYSPPHTPVGSFCLTRELTCLWHPDPGSLLHCPTSSDTGVHLQSFLYRSAELGDDPPRVSTPDYCSPRDNHVSTSLRGREGEEGGEKGGRTRGRKRWEGRKGEGGEGGEEWL